MRRITLVGSLLLASLAGGACAPPAPRPPARPARFAAGALPPPVFTDPQRKAKLLAALPALDALFAARREKLGVPGLAVGVVIDGEIVFDKGFGARELTGHAPVDGDTVFRIASLTKSFIAMAILQLRDEGRLSLEDPAERYLPELAEVAYPTRDSARITVRQLLTHGAGFPEDNPWADRPRDMPEDVYARGLPFSHAPDVAYEYSDLGYVLLGMMVSRISGVPFQRYVTERILRPLGMTATVFDEREVPKARLALGYRREDGKLVNEKNTPDGVFGAMGGLYSSLHDLARYAAFHLAAWPPRDDPEPGPLRRSSVREMGQAARSMSLAVWHGGLDGVPAGGGMLSYGFGLVSRESCELDHIIQHGGGLPGYGAFLSMLPEHGVALITLANTAAWPAVNDAARVLLASGGLAPRTTVPAPALVAARDAIGSLLGRWDDGVAQAAFDPSFFLGRPAPKLAAALEKLRGAHGACSSSGAIDAENALRGKWRLTCERGWIDLRVTLAPEMPPRIQLLAEEGSLPPSERLTAAAARAAALTERWDDGAFAELFAPSVERVRQRELFAGITFARGACKLGLVQRGDGRMRARFRLSCDRHPVELEVTLDYTSGKVTEAKFSPVDPRVVKCAQ